MDVVSSLQKIRVLTQTLTGDTGNSRLLVRHPNAMARLRGEIASVMKGETHPSREQIRKMLFLSCVIKESMYLSLEV